MDEVLTAKEVAEFMKCDVRTARRLMSEKAFPLIDPDKQRYRSVLKTDLIAYLRWKRSQNGNLQNFREIGG